MAKIDKEIRDKYIKKYSTKKAIRWKVSIPDGHGNQIRAQKFLDYESAHQFAKEEYTKVLLQTNKMTGVSYSNITFKEFVEQWLRIKRQDGLKEVTLKRYREQIDLYLTPYFGSIKLNCINKNHLRNYITDSLAKEISSYNLRNTVIIFKMILRHAIDEDLVDAAAILTVKTPKHRPKDPQFWDQKEMRYFLNALRGSKRYRLWKFVLWTGMRAGEIAALKWECVFLDLQSGNHTGYIRVCRSVAQRTKVISETTKNGKNRMIPIFPELRDLILEMKQEETGVFVFGGNETLEPVHFSRDLRTDLRKIPSLKSINFHGLRHTFCSYLDSTGMNRRIVSEIMGHSDMATTDRYSHVTNQTLGLEVDRWLQSQNQQNSNNLSVVAF